MKLAMTLMVRNEEDIIDANIRYHLAQGIDFFIVTNNGSTDGTASRLRDYEQQGCMRILDVHDDSFDQSRWVTRMARMASTDFQADWIIHNDADEFWWPMQGDLKTTFSALPEEVNVVVAARNNFVFTPHRKRQSFLDLIYREAISLNVLGKPLPPKIAHRSHPDAVIATGNHSVENIGPQTACRDVMEIFHFPIRSEEQFLNKIETGIAPVMRHIEKHPGDQLGTWKHLYKETTASGNKAGLMKELTYHRCRLLYGLITRRIVRDTRLREYLRATN